jgi:hypothetical protein
MARQVVNADAQDRGRMGAAVEWTYGDSASSREAQGCSKENAEAKPVGHITAK